ncbi:hypothetical protein [Saccharothrix sp. NRRL B-16314]|uniref:hypothetical protein n=1 Tax=Saccharothrix sp. NRRL B-16314 TaxID=1463825 RepID=UPI000AF09FD3|nr:hypothetical protein [Saccharothrix sp. NRRL B-16314]
MSSPTTTRKTSVVESTARARYESTHPGRSWHDAPAYLRDRVRLVERQRTGAADDE